MKGILMFVDGRLQRNVLDRMREQGGFRDENRDGLQLSAGS